MADNYLENRLNDLLSHRPAKRYGSSHSLDSLLTKNRSYRGYRKEYVVTEEMLKRLVAVNTKVPSGRNRQVLRFKTVTRETGAAAMLPLIKLGGALPELHLPFEGTEPEAFIIVCSTVPEDRIVDIDLGISVQSMLLKAVDMGLGGIIIAAFNREEVKRTFALPYEPLLVVAIGKGAEKIELVPINADDDHTYYRKDGVHYVPKVKVEDLLL